MEIHCASFHRGINFLCNLIQTTNIKLFKHERSFCMFEVFLSFFSSYYYSFLVSLTEVINDGWIRSSFKWLSKSEHKQKKYIYIQETLRILLFSLSLNNWPTGGRWSGNSGSMPKCTWLVCYPFLQNDLDSPLLFRYRQFLSYCSNPRKQTPGRD